MEELFPLRIGYAEKQLWYPKYHLIVLSTPWSVTHENIYVKCQFSKNQQQSANRMLFAGEIWLDKRIKAALLQWVQDPERRLNKKDKK